MSDPIAPGSKVRVRGIDGLVLKVEVEPGSTPAGPGPLTAEDDPQPAPAQG
jgi:hypothetical protein